MKGLVELWMSCEVVADIQKNQNRLKVALLEFFLLYFSLITDYCPYLVLEFIQSSSRTILSNIRYLTPLRPERYPIDSRDPSFLFVFPMLGKSSQTQSKYICIFLKRVVLKNHSGFESIALHCRNKPHVHQYIN